MENERTVEERLEKIETELKELKELLMKPQRPSVKDKKRFINQYRLQKALIELELENQTNTVPKTS